jgi:hypothetical protein
MREEEEEERKKERELQDPKRICGYRYFKREKDDVELLMRVKKRQTCGGGVRR